LIPMPEYLIKKTIEEGLSGIKEQPVLLDKMFRYLPADVVVKIKKFICSKPIPVLISFPREPAQMPCYCIVLGQETETGAGLGSDVYEGFDDRDIITESMTCKVLYDFESDAQYVSLSGAHEPMTAISAVWDSSGDDVSYTWDKAKKRLIIHDDVLADDDLAVQYTTYFQGEGSIGTMFNVSYRIECWSDNGDLTAYLYHIAKYIMLANREAYEEEGLVKSTIAGAEFEPVPDYFPQFAYRRGLIWSALTDNTIESDFDILQNIHVKSRIFREGE